jgi:hypothetical protein
MERTWHRPRDVIDFVNACIRKSEGKAKFSRDTIAEAEGEYSRGRLRALTQEWHAEYPNLPACVKALLARRESHFPAVFITDNDICDWALDLAVADQDAVERGSLWHLAKRCADAKEDAEEARREILSILFKTGCVGLKLASGDVVQWATSESYNVSPSEISEETEVYVHAGLWRVLGIKA